MTIMEGVDGAHAPSFSLGNRIRRGVWALAYGLLFRFSPRICHRWRAFVLKAFGARLGKNVHIYPGVRIWAPWLLEVGDDAGVADGVRIYNLAKVMIGRRCVISQGAYLCSGSHDIHSANFQLVARPICIEAFAWVCAEAFVGPGVTVAEGSVVAARAVLVRSIQEPWKIWAGNPAVFKGRRSDAIKVAQG